MTTTWRDLGPEAIELVEGSFAVPPVPKNPLAGQVTEVVEALAAWNKAACLGAEVPALDLNRLRSLVDDWSGRYIFINLRYPVKRDLQVALIATAMGLLDYVPRLLGLGKLSGSVQASRTFDNPRSLVRQLATAKKLQLGTASCETGFKRFLKTFPEAGPGLERPRWGDFWWLARIYFHDLGGLPLGQVGAALHETLATFAGASPKVRPEHSLRAGPVPRAAAFDPHVGVFEHFLPLLTNTAERKRVSEHLEETLAYWAEKRPRHPIIAGADLGFLALTGERDRVLKVCTEHRDVLEANPGAAVVAACLGVDIELSRLGVLQRLFDEPDQLGALSKSSLKYYVETRQSTELAFRALAANLPQAVPALTGGGVLTAFRPGKKFGGETRPVLRYVAAAMKAHAPAQDVEPAWLDFLAAARFRAGLAGFDPAASEPGGSFGWAELFALAAAFFHRLGGIPVAEVGAALERTIQGQPVALPPSGPRASVAEARPQKAKRAPKGKRAAKVSAAKVKRAAKKPAAKGKSAAKEKPAAKGKPAAKVKSAPKGTRGAAKTRARG